MSKIVVGVYAKAIIAALLSGLFATQTALLDGNITSLEGVTVAIAVLASLGGVAIVTNQTKPAEAEPEVEPEVQPVDAV